MLRIRFFNVGDGDAILVEDITASSVYRMLIDTGRYLPAEPAPSAICVDHLKRLRISHIDKLVITHLHADHAGGLEPLMSEVVIDEIVSGYIPLNVGAQIPWDASADKSIRGMVACVNQWSKDVNRLRSFGCRTTELYASWRSVRLTDRLTADFIVPDLRGLRLQREVWNRMLEPRPVSAGQKARASKLRNPNSLRIRLHYAGREIELSGDCYASEWENADVAPCDIFKVPHHGDDKAVTDALLARLRPAHAVISCSRFYQPAKDRPSADTIAQLRRIGAQVWFTDEFADGIQPPRSWASVDFDIHEDGRIIPPVRRI